MRKEIKAKDAREGNWFEGGTTAGRRFAGELYRFGDAMYVAGWRVVDERGRLVVGVWGRFFREVPDLPTELKSVIAWEGGFAVFGPDSDDDEIPWYTFRHGGRCRWQSEEELLEEIGSSEWWVVDMSKPGETSE